MEPREAVSIRCTGRLHVKRYSWILYGLITVGLTGCTARETRTLGGTQTPQEGRISKQELRDELNKFEDYFISAMKRTVEEIEAADPSRRMERNNVQMQTRIVEALHAMSQPDDAIIAYLDIWGLVVRLKMYMEQGQGRALYDQNHAALVSFIGHAETEIERIGNLFLTTGQFAELKTGIYNFAQQYPVGGTFANLIMYPTEIKKDQDNVFLKTLSIPMAPFRVIEGVDRTAEEISRFRNTADRFTSVLEQMPESARWQMSIIMDDFEESRMTQRFLKSLEDFTQSNARLNEVLDTLPEQVRTEMTTLLNESDQSQANLQTTLKTASETAARLERMLSEFQKTSQSVNLTAQQADDAAKAVKDASDSIQKLVGMFQTDKPREADAPRPFGMRDFDTMLLNAGRTAEKITDAARQLQQTTDPESELDIIRQTRSLVDHTAWRLFQLFLAMFVLFLFYRYLNNKFPKRT